ncbi:MAG: hypothetical protein KDB69_06025 [Acidimicrobiia bacterium]|nr:hypothetical protein [Acidimicrobiia bacterium]
MHRRIILLVAVAVGTISVFALGYAVAGLADGIVEAPRHWWSSLPVVGIAAAAFLLILGSHMRSDR